VGRGRASLPPAVTDEQWTQYSLGAKFRESPFLLPIRDKVLEKAALTAGDTLLDVGTGDGLIAFAALDYVGPDGVVIFSDIAQGLVDHCRAEAEQAGVAARCRFVRASADDLSAIPDESVDALTARSVLNHVPTNAKLRAFREFFRVLKPTGRLSTFQPINGFAAALPEPPHLFFGYDVTPVADIADKIHAYQRQLRPPERHSSLNYDERDLFRFAEEAGFTRIGLDYHAHVGPAAPARHQDWEKWLHARRGPGARELTVAEALENALTPTEAERFTAHLQLLVEAGQAVPRPARHAETYLWAVKDA
jgi:arsenite methyltransferase